MYFPHIYKSTKNIDYNTKRASNTCMCYTLPTVRTNYGIFNIRFKGPAKYGTQLVKIWKPSMFQSSKNH